MWRRCVLFPCTALRCAAVPGCCMCSYVRCAQINLRDDTDEVQDYLAQLTGGRSVPRVRGTLVLM